MRWPTYHLAFGHQIVYIRTHQELGSRCQVSDFRCQGAASMANLAHSPFPAPNSPLLPPTPPSRSSRLAPRNSLLRAQNPRRSRDSRISAAKMPMRNSCNIRTSLPANNLRTAVQKLADAKPQKPRPPHHFASQALFPPRNTPSTSRASLLTTRASPTHQL